MVTLLDFYRVLLLLKMFLFVPSVVNSRKPMIGKTPGIVAVAANDWCSKGLPFGAIVLARIATRIISSLTRIMALPDTGCMP